MIPGVLAKKFDGIFAWMTITEERKKQIDFTDPYYKTAAAFVAGEATKIDFADKALGGIAIGTIPGAAQCYLEKTYPSASIKVYQNAEDMFLDMGANRLDAVFSDQIQLDFGLLQTERGKGLAFQGESVSEPGCFGEGIGIGLRKEDTGAARSAEQGHRGGACRRHLQDHQRQVLQLRHLRSVIAAYVGMRMVDKA